MSGNMSPGESRKVVRIELGDPADLLRTPDADPYSRYDAALLGLPGICLALRDYGPRWYDACRGGCLEITVPPETFTPALDTEIASALARFSAVRIAENQRKIRAIVWDGLRSLPYSLGFLAVCLSLSFLISGGRISLSPFLQQVFSEGLVIIGWVSLWSPVEALLFDWRPFRRQNRILEVLASMSLSFHPAPG